MGERYLALRDGDRERYEKHEDCFLQFYKIFLIPQKMIS
jgi:hypothetical protein